MNAYRKLRCWVEGEYGRAFTLRFIESIIPVVLVFLAGFVIEPSKVIRSNNVTLKSQIEKKRLIIMSDTWSRLYEMEALAKDFLEQSASTGSKGKSLDELKAAQPKMFQMHERFESKSSEFNQFIMTNRFWYASSSYRLLVKHNENQARVLDAVVRNDHEAYKALIPELNSTRKNIYSYLEQVRF